MHGLKNFNFLEYRALYNLDTITVIVVGTVLNMVLQSKLLQQSALL